MKNRLVSAALALSFVSSLSGSEASPCPIQCSEATPNSFIVNSAPVISIPLRAISAHFFREALTTSSPLRAPSIGGTMIGYGGSVSLRQSIISTKRAHPHS